MCIDCWDEAGRPWLRTEKVDAWASRFAETDRFGPLHIVVEDWNFDDEDILFCRKAAVQQDDIDLCDALLSMSLAERYTVAMMAEEALAEQ